jgi:hypothetical protein
VQQHAICFYPSERNQRRDRHFEAEEVDELFHGLGEDPVGAKCHPRLLSNPLDMQLSKTTHQKRASSTKTVFIQPEDRNTRASML